MNQRLQPRLIPITIIAILNFVGGGSLLYVFKDHPLPLLGFFLVGDSAKIYHLATAVLNIYLGIGFLRLTKHSWYLWMGWTLFLFINCLFNLVLITEVTVGRYDFIVQDPAAFIRMFRGLNFFAIMYSVFLLLYVYSARKHFGVSHLNP